MLSRGQRLDTRDWKIGNYVHQYGAHQIYIPEGVDKDGFDSYHIDPGTLGWASNYHDINGKLIFTDDIVAGSNYHSDNVFIGVVRLGEYFTYGDVLNYGYYIEWITSAPLRRQLPVWVKDKYLKLEVIGNIYDNKDLLERYS